LALCEVREICPLNGKVGAIILDGCSFIMSPNQKHIPYPPLGDQHPVQLCMDSHYADDDPILWLQPFIPYFSHHGAIPWPSSLPLHSVIWLTPNIHEHFQCHMHPGAPIHGLGKLSDPTFLALKISVNSLLDHVKLYQADTPSTKQPPTLQHSVKMLEHGLARLESVYTNFWEMEFSMQDVQWMWLELTAMLEYIQIYKPWMDGYTPSASQVANMIGVFMHDLQVAQDFITAGLPCWLIHQASDFTNQIILKIIEPQCTEGIITLAAHKYSYPVIFTGPASSLEKYRNILQYARNFLCVPNPFNISTVSPSIDTSANSLLVASPSIQAYQNLGESLVVNSST
jgi:hypothetical protein